MLDSAIGLKGGGRGQSSSPPSGRPIGASRRKASRSSVSIKTSCSAEGPRRPQCCKDLWNFEASKTLGRVLQAALPDKSTVVHLHGYAKALSASVKHRSARPACGLHVARLFSDVSEWRLVQLPETGSLP